MPSEPLPLFPLNVVLFPRMPLPLHVFEERYKTMIRRCIENDEPFGVVLIRDGEEAGPPAIPETIGTLARIRIVEQLDEGRLNLLTEGVERFRLLDYATGVEPYLIGIIERFVDEPVDATDVRPLIDDVSAIFAEYFKLLVAYAGQDLPEYELPEDPVDLSFVIAAVLQLENHERQSLLEMTDTAARLAEERSRLITELERVRAASDTAGRPFERITKEWRKPFESLN